MNLIQRIEEANGRKKGAIEKIQASILAKRPRKELIQMYNDLKQSYESDVNEFEQQLIQVENDIYEYNEEKQKRRLHREQEIEHNKSLEPSLASRALSGIGSLGLGTATLLGQGLLFGGRRALSVGGAVVEGIATGAVQVYDANTRRSERIQQEREEALRQQEEASRRQERERRQQAREEREQEEEEREELPEYDPQYEDKDKREQRIKEIIAKIYINTDEFKETIKGLTTYEKTKKKKETRDDILTGHLKPFLPRDKINELNDKIKTERIPKLKKGEHKKYYRSNTLFSHSLASTD